MALRPTSRATTLLAQEDITDMWFSFRWRRRNTRCFILGISFLLPGTFGDMKNSEEVIGNVLAWEWLNPTELQKAWVEEVYFSHYRVRHDENFCKIHLKAWKSTRRTINLCSLTLTSPKVQINKILSMRYSGYWGMLLLTPLSQMHGTAPSF